MQILWRLEKAFVREIRDEMQEPKPPVTTVSSIVRKLEDRGLIGYESFGKAHRYFPVLAKEEYRKSSFNKLLNQYFKGSAEELLSFFVKEEAMDMEELNKLLEKIKQSEQGKKKN